MNLRDQILAAQDANKEAVSVTEWGLETGLFIRTLSAKDRDQWETSMVSVDVGRQAKVRKVNLANMRARLVVLTLVDADGKRVLGDEDADALGEKSAAVIARLFDVAQRVNALSADEVKALEKNSVTSPDGDSASS
jgi:hypothetical protein